MKKGVLVGVTGFAYYWEKVFIPYARDVEKKMELVGAVSHSDKNFPEAMKRLGLARDQMFTDLDEALAVTGADFVMLTVHPLIREKMIDIALAHNCDIITEKPLAPDMESCVRIWKKVKASGRKMMVTMTHRFSQDKQTLENEVKSGKYGPLSSLHARLVVARTKGDYEDTWHHKIRNYYVMGETVHQMDILRSIAGSNCKKIYCKSWDPDWAPFHPTSAVALIAEMENGVVCTYNGTDCSAAHINWWYEDYIRAECRDSVLILDKKQLTAHKAVNIEWDDHLNIHSEETVTRLPMLEQDKWGNTLLLSQFLDWINGGLAPVTTVDDNMYLMAMVYSAIESIETGREVDVREFYGRYVGGEEWNHDQKNKSCCLE